MAREGDQPIDTDETDRGGKIDFIKLLEAVGRTLSSAELAILSQLE